MARLTRTQKYAELRNQLENGRETQLETEDLSKYEDRLGALKSEAEDTKVIEEVKDTIEEENEEVVEKAALDVSLDRILAQMNEDVQKHIGPKKEEEKVEEVAIDELLGKEEAADQDIQDDVSKTAEEAETIEKMEDESSSESEVKEVKEDLSIEDLMHTSIDDNYLKDTLSEVNEYNRSLGSITADELPKTILNEIRGVNDKPKDDDLSNTVTLEIKKILSELDEEPSEEKVEAPKAEVEPKVEGKTPLVAQETLKQIEPERIVDNASNQVDLDEIRKAVDGLPKDVGDLLRQYLEQTQEDVFETPKGEEKQDTSEEVLDANRELEKTVQVTSVAEVKEETPNEEAVNIESVLMNETMPLQVEKTQALSRVDEEEEEEEGASSKILNIILIVLIIILVLVLIVVAYLILVAQGIIPSLF